MKRAFVAHGLPVDSLTPPLDLFRGRSRSPPPWLFSTSSRAGGSSKTSSTAAKELRERLAALRDDIPLIWDVRGLGLMIGAELRDAEGQPLPAETMQELKLAARDAGVLLSISNTTVILTPPLVISSEESEQLISVLEACIRPIAAHRRSFVTRR